MFHSSNVPGLFSRAQVNYMAGGREMHAYLFTNKGVERARFMGPGTSVLERVRRGDQPVSGADKVALAHDLRYTLANGNAAAEREADKKMIAKLQDPKVDNMLNRAIGRIPIKAKVAAEKLGVMTPGSFSKGPALNQGEKDLVQTKLDELELGGFGLPGSRLRSMLRQRGGLLPHVPSDLPMGVSAETMAQIRNIAAALNMPQRADEWIIKQNLSDYYMYTGMTAEEAQTAAFGREQPWQGIVDENQATIMTPPAFAAPRRPAPQPMDMEEDDEGYYKDYHHPVKAPRGKPKRGISKQAFLERMAEGRRKAAAKRRKTGTKKPARKLTVAKRRTLAGRAKKMFKRMGRGLKLAGEGLELAGGFHLPDTVEDYAGVAKHLADHAQKHFRISVPAEMVGSIGEQLSGMGGDWSDLQTRLSGLQTL